MTDTNWQKLVEEDTPFSDDFDEDLLSEIQEQFQKGSAANFIGAKESKAPVAKKSSAEEEFLAFENFTQPLKQEDASQEIELDPSFGAPTPQPEKRSSPSGSVSEASSKRNKIAPITCLGVLMLFGVGALTYFLLFSIGTEVSHLGKIRRPIPLHFFTDKQEYFFISNLGGEAAFLKVELELTFEGEAAEQFLKNRKVELRDLIYSFLVEQNPSGNTFSQWQPIIESSLLTTIRRQMPRCNTQDLVITYLERI